MAIFSPINLYVPPVNANIPSSNRSCRFAFVSVYLIAALTILALIGLAIFYFFTDAATHTAPSGDLVTPLDMPMPWHPSPLRAWVAYEWSGGLYTTRTDTGRTRRVAERGTYPRWSPDGRHLAYWRGNDLLQADADGSNPAILAQAQEPHGLAYNPDGSEILFVDAKSILAVSLQDRSVRTVLAGLKFREIDLASDGRLVASAYTMPKHGVFGFNLVASNDWKIGTGCSASLSPDGRFSTRNATDHCCLHIDDWATGTKLKDLPAPPGCFGDNQFWSNADDWIAIAAGLESADIYIQRVSDARIWKITFCRGCDRPDLFVPPKFLHTFVTSHKWVTFL
jgi:hypothetical protein